MWSFATQNIRTSPFRIGHIAPDTVGMASSTQSNIELAPQPTLLGLPAELRDEIYFLVAAGNIRPLLVSRLMQVQAQMESLPDKKNNVPLETLLNNAVGLRPLSRTCRQLRDEFQPLFLHESEPHHRLIINNFDVAQTEFVTNFLDKHRPRGFQTIGVRRYTSHSGIHRYTSHSGVAHKVKVELYGDSDIVKSADAFLEHIIAKSDLREHLIAPTTRPAFRMILSNRLCTASYDTSPQLIIRRRTPDMSLRQAARAVTTLQLDETRRIFRCIESIIYDFGPTLGSDGPDPWGEEAVHLMRYVWNERLRRSTDDWEEMVTRCRSVAQRYRDYHNRMRLGG